MTDFADISDTGSDRGRRAHIGHYVSGAAHVGLIGWLLLGPLFEVEPLPFDVTNVSTVSEEEYAALVAASAPQEPVPDAVPEIAPAAPAEPTVPDTAEAPPPAPVEETPAPQAPTPQETAPAPEPESLPDVPPPPAPPAPPEDTAPPEPAPLANEDIAVVLPEVSPRPTPRPAPRVAPEPVAPSEPDVAIEDTTQDAVVPDESVEAPAPQPEQEATAQEEATDQIVTEADEVPSGAPEVSMRPRSRPTPPPAPVQPEQPTETVTTEAPTPTPAPTPDATADAVADALAEALGGDAAPTPAPSVPSGPPLTGGEREALRVAVQQCWLVDVGSAAARVTVVVSMDMEENGRVVANSIRMTGSSGGDANAAEVAFQAARRAIIRCQKDGYNLPVDKYGQWRQIEMTFNPENVGR